MSRQWVLIRGIMSEAYHWWEFLPQLQAQFPQDEFHTADILGNGRLHASRTPLSIKKNVEALRNQAPDSGKKILVGFSLGGMLALEWAKLYREEVEAVVLINASLNNSPFYKRITPYSISCIVKSALQKDHRKREENIIRMTTSNISDETRIEVAKLWGARGLQYPVNPFNFFWQIGLASQIKQPAQPPTATLILSSSKDRVVHPDCSRLIANRWNLPLESHPDAGHDLTLEDPQWVLEKVRQFLNSGILNDDSN